LHTYHAKVEAVVPMQKMTQQMKWHKEGIHDSEDIDIMSHPADAGTWHVLDHFDP
jgi:hypothetical protein